MPDRRIAKPAIGKCPRVPARGNGHRELGVEICPGLDDALRKAPPGADEALGLGADAMSVPAADDPVRRAEPVEFQLFGRFQIPLQPAVAAKDAQPETAAVAGRQSRGHQRAGHPVVKARGHKDRVFERLGRGPQNTLYGRNTTGGAVNFISRRPEVGGETNGYLNVGFGRYSEANVEGAVGFPIGDRAAMRFSIQSQNRDGIRTNLIDGDEDVERDKIAARAQLAFEPNDRVSVNLKAHVERIDQDNGRYKTLGRYAPNATGPDPAQLCATPFELGACSNGFGVCRLR